MSSPNSNLYDSGNDAYSPEIRRAIEFELETICSSPLFRTSRRNRDFLHYIVREVLAGRASEIRERTLGKELFGRPITYDTGADSVVRVRANNLRKKLAAYYETHRSRSGWRIHLPVRTYAPEFLREEISDWQDIGMDQNGDSMPAMRVAEQQAHFEPANVAAVDSRMSVSIPDGTKQAQGIAPVPWLLKDDAKIPASHMMIPTFIVFFLCVAALRWQGAYGSPYLVFWGSLLSDRTGIAVVFDEAPPDNNTVTASDLQMIDPLLQTAAHFHAAANIAVSDAAVQPSNHDALLTVHISHRLLRGEDSFAAYVTVVPGAKAQVWVNGRNTVAMSNALHSLSDNVHFPSALEVAVLTNTPMRIRFTDVTKVTAQQLEFASPAGEVQ